MGRLATCAVLLLIVASTTAAGTTAGAANRHPAVALKLSMTGIGTVHVTGSKPYTCRAPLCRHTFRVRRGRRIVLHAAPAAEWKLAKWAGVCTGKSASCSLRLHEPARVSVTFVPPGARLNPYPLGTAVRLDGGWQMTVNSATIDADTQVEAVTDQYGHPLNPPPPAGEQYALVNVSLTYVGTGFRNVFGYVDHWLGAQGAGNDQYQLGCTPPLLDLSTVLDPIYPGQTVTGNLCFEITSSDASRLLLFGTVTTPADSFKFAYFALR